eukprot:6469855-Amphidinium_carterae.1
MQSADEYLWNELAVFTRQGLTADGQRIFPCDVEVERILALPVFQLRLQPLQMSASVSSSSVGVSLVHGDERPAKMQKTSKGVGKSKQQSGLSAVATKPPQSFPAELAGHCWKTSSGAPLCFAYKLGKCENKKKDGQRCSRGWHLCAFKMSSGHACGVAHPFCKHA